MKKDAKNPFPQESDEVTITEEKKKASNSTPPPRGKVDFDGIEGRVAKLRLVRIITAEWRRTKAI
ncbi:MAG: hypothetical protein IPK98_03210 [Chloracidobacterium sp.]|nr:hypothetical protein [Chloracidobacterium sp.]